MAEGGSDVTSVTSQETREGLTCALCLDVFREPKLLPCSHTFCLKCLKDLVDHASSKNDSAASEDGVKAEKTLDTERPAGKSFACPSCRKEIQVPEELVVAFRINVDIDPGELERLRDDTHCAMHQGRPLNIFCVECDIIICRECKIDHHFHHKSQSIEDAALIARTQLSKEKPRIQELFHDLQENLKKREQDLKEFQAKRAVVEREIRQRYSTIVAEAEKFRDEALDALQSSSIEVESTLNKELDDVRRNLAEARHLRERIEKAEKKGEGCHQVTVAKEMTSGSGSEAGIKRLRDVGHVTEVKRPVHRSELPDDDTMFKTMKKFIGSSELVTMQSEEEEEEEGLEAKEMFRCGDHDDVNVYCVKAKKNGKVNMSFDPFFQEQKPPAKKHNENDGSCKIYTNSKSLEQFGPRSFSIIDETFMFYINKKNIHAKTLASNTCGWGMIHSENGYTVESSELVSAKTFETKDEKLFSISPKRCRSFDVGCSGTQFVVVTEPGDQSEEQDNLIKCFDNNTEELRRQRQVVLYKRPHTVTRVSPVDTYTSPVTPFQPADVCFFTLQGTQMLLIADEANDAIHVVEVKDDRMTFTRFLCPGCPVLLQPTALNTDHKGRLWVGCRGGRLLTFQPVNAEGGGGVGVAAAAEGVGKQ